MERRFQMLNGDAVLEITETKEVKTRHSKTRLAARKIVLLEMQERLTREIAEIDTILTEIQNEEAKLS